MLVGNNITMRDGTQVLTNNGDIRVEATTGDIAVAVLNAGTADIAVVALAGSIIDIAGDSNNPDLVATNALLAAGTDIGASDDATKRC